jgi:hypothetical protein
MFEMGGTLSTLMTPLRTDLRKPNEFDRYIDSLTEDMQEFFRVDFCDSYDSTRKEVNVRLQQIKQRPILRAMFDTTERRVDLFDCMQKRKIVLVNTGMARDQVTSQMVGRFIIAMTLNATYIRSTMPRSQWHPTFLIIDEFQEFVDESKTPEMLRLAREYNLGIMMAHHNMYGAELDEALRVAISTNTSIKFCADPRGMDLNYMARDFNCDPSFLRMQQVTDTHVRFAHVMRRVYDTPISIMVPRGNLDRYPKHSRQDINDFDRLNTWRVHGDIFSNPRPAVSVAHISSVPPAARPSNPITETKEVPVSPARVKHDPDDFA